MSEQTKKTEPVEVKSKATELSEQDLEQAAGGGSALDKQKILHKEYPGSPSTPSGS